MATLLKETVITLLIVAASTVTCTESNYFGRLIGSLDSQYHGVRGDVYAVDARTLFIKGFSYDGQGEDTVFFAGSSAKPGPDGFVIPNESGSTDGLSRSYDNNDLILTLPEGKTLKEIRWMSVWSRPFSAVFGEVKIPTGFDYPRPQRLNALSGEHKVGSDRIYAVDAQTFLIPNFTYDGAAPDAFFWVGKGPKPSKDGIKIPDENGKLEPLRRYDSKTLVLTLPGDITVFDVDWLSIWCRAFYVDFGHVRIPKNLNVPPSLKMLGVAPQAKLNCEVLWDELALEVRWAVAGETIVLQLVGKIDDGSYISFGPSGDPKRSRMVGADVAVGWLDRATGKGYVHDYFMTSKSQCAGNRGVCPDTSIPNSANNIRLLNAALVNDYVMLTYQRPLKAQDEEDKPIITNGTQAVVWAVGPLNSKGEPSYHKLRNRGDILIDFGRSPFWNCPAPEEPNPSVSTVSKEEENTWSSLVSKAEGVPSPRPVPKIPKSWYIPAIECHEPENRVYYAHIGPTGGAQGYNAITGHVGWGISWYINGLLIPEVTVVRGQTYTFVVEGGQDPDRPARHHPFYITDDPEGGYEFKTPAERSQVRVFAGVTYDREGNPAPTASGRLCEWVEDPAHPADAFASFGAYQRTLKLHCEEGQPAILHWTPDENTPDIVYYQCYTHRFLGWKIRVVDKCDTSNNRKTLDTSASVSKETVAGPFGNVPLNHRPVKEGVDLREGQDYDHEYYDDEPDVLKTNGNSNVAPLPAHKLQEKTIQKESPEQRLPALNDEGFFSDSSLGKFPSSLEELIGDQPFSKDQDAPFHPPSLIPNKEKQPNRVPANKQSIQSGGRLPPHVNQRPPLRNPEEPSLLRNTPLELQKIPKDPKTSKPNVAKESIVRNKPTSVQDKLPGHQFPQEPPIQPQFDLPVKTLQQLPGIPGESPHINPFDNQAFDSPNNRDQTFPSIPGVAPFQHELQPQPPFNFPSVFHQENQNTREQQPFSQFNQPNQPHPQQDSPFSNRPEQQPPQIRGPPAPQPPQKPQIRGPPPPLNQAPPLNQQPPQVRPPSLQNQQPSQVRAPAFQQQTRPDRPETPEIPRPLSSDFIGNPGLQFVQGPSPPQSPIALRPFLSGSLPNKPINVVVEQPHASIPLAINRGFDPSSVVLEGGFKPMRNIDGPIPPLGFEVEAHGSQQQSFVDENSFQSSSDRPNLVTLEPLFVPSELELKNRTFKHPIPVNLPVPIVPVVPGLPQKQLDKPPQHRPPPSNSFPVAQRPVPQHTFRQPPQVPQRKSPAQTLLNFVAQRRQPQTPASQTFNREQSQQPQRLQQELQRQPVRPFAGPPNPSHSGIRGPPPSSGRPGTNTPIKPKDGRNPPSQESNTRVPSKPQRPSRFQLLSRLLQGDKFQEQAVQTESPNKPAHLPARGPARIQQRPSVLNKKKKPVIMTFQGPLTPIEEKTSVNNKIKKNSVVMPAIVPDPISASIIKGGPILGIQPNGIKPGITEREKQQLESFLFGPGDGYTPRSFSNGNSQSLPEITTEPNAEHDELDQDSENPSILDDDENVDPKSLHPVENSSDIALSTDVQSNSQPDSEQNEGNDQEEDAHIGESGETRDEHAADRKRRTADHVSQHLDEEDHPSSALDSSQLPMEHRAMEEEEFHVRERHPKFSSASSLSSSVAVGLMLLLCCATIW